MILGWRQGWATETEASWAVVSDSDRVVGRVALKHLDRQEAGAEVAYWIAPDLESPVAERTRFCSQRIVLLAARMCCGLAVCGS